MAIFEIIVSNVGKVFESDSRSQANYQFAKYVDLSKQRTGRASGENVTMFCEGEVDDEYIPINTLYDGGKCPDCGYNIPNDTNEGDRCSKCYFLFNTTED